MIDAAENIAVTALAEKASALAEREDEGFVLAVTAAYLAGKKAGQLVALKPIPPAA